VVASAKYLSLRERDVPTLYGYLLGGGGLGPLELSVRTAPDPRTIAAAIQREAAAVAAAAVVTEVRTLTTQVDQSLSVERLVARLLTAFAVLALLLAAIGLYGVLGYSVVRRTAEIGVRLALGATRGAVIRSVLTQSGMLVGIGSVIGTIAALLLTRFLRSLLYEVTPTDPSVMFFAVSCLFVVGLSAAAVPAWRASRVDPLIALRHE
jgi:putative ABC transport system permease protein